MNKKGEGEFFYITKDSKYFEYLYTERDVEYIYKIIRPKDHPGFCTSKKCAILKNN
jgi:hypothetical protein